MKKKQQAIISIVSFIIILTFTGSSFAQEICVLKWWTNSTYCVPESCDDVSGIAPTAETSRTQVAAQELMEQLPFLVPNISLDGTWSYYWEYGGYPIPYYIVESFDGGWDVICDTDNDTVYDDTDNCPNTSNPNQEDADNDTIGDVCDTDTIYGTISGAVQGGVTIDINVYSCGTATTVATITTNDEGYYAVGGLGTDSYGIVPQYADYVFSPKTRILQVPQTDIRSYDFTAIAP